MVEQVQRETEAKLQEEVRGMVGREVMVCLSSLVSTLAQGYGELSSRSELGELAEQAFELASPIPDWEATADETDIVIHAGAAEWSYSRGSEERFPLVADTEEEAWREACETENLDPQDREVYEHWAVSSWLGRKLSERGEKVDTDFAGMVVWARCCTGQAIYLDEVMRDIWRGLQRATA